MDCGDHRPYALAASRQAGRRIDLEFQRVYRSGPTNLDSPISVIAVR